MNARAYQLYNPDVTEETLAWIWSVTSFVNWLSGGDGVFWISGKPASGKSTLIQHIKSHDRILSLLGRSNDMEWRILYFFFDFRGAKSITNNSEGLLRSLLFQLIESVPHLDTSGIEKLERGHASSWHESELRDALRVTLRSVSGGICIFIDGLDEYEGNLRHLIEFLTGLSASDRVARKSIKICISSRPEPIPSLLLRDLPSLSMSAHNAGGITSYCRQILKDLDIELSYFSESIAKRAEGVFLWARFAIEELIQGVSEGEDHLELLNRLDSFPQDLEDVYDRMLSRLDISATKECMIMLQLVCFEKRFESLNCWELHAATRFAVDKTLILPESVKCETGQKPHERIVAKSCGFLELIEVRYSQTRLYKSEGIHIVKLIHKSVETYLSKKGWNALQGRIQENQVSHELLLLQLCVQYIKSVLDHMGLQDLTDLQVWNTEFKITFGRKIRTSMLSYPFLQYAAISLFSHARALERQHSVSSYEYLYGSLTEQVIFTHYFVSTTPFPSKMCCACAKSNRMPLHSSSLQTLAAFLHGLALYCKDALATNPTLEEVFADRALLCAIRSSNLDNDDDNFATTVTSLALKIVNVVKQHHLELALDTIWNTDGALLILQHESVKTLRLFDQKGREVKMPWMFAHAPRFKDENDQEALRNVMEGIMNAARDRGEDLREQCGPEGNLVETLLQQIENLDTSRPFWGNHVEAVKIKLRLICTYYQARSWPFDYDLRTKSHPELDLSNPLEESSSSDGQGTMDERSFSSERYSDSITSEQSLVT